MRKAGQGRGYTLPKGELGTVSVNSWVTGGHLTQKRAFITDYFVLHKYRFSLCCQLANKLYYANKTYYADNLNSFLYFSIIIGLYTLLNRSITKFAKHPYLGNITDAVYMQHINNNMS